MNIRSAVSFLRSVASEYAEDNAMSLAASLAYYTAL